MKNKYIIGALLVGIISLFASCSDDNDSNPTLIQPKEFVLNTPTYANATIDLERSTGLELTWSQPKYTADNAPINATYEVQVSPTNSFTVSTDEAAADESGEKVPDYAVLSNTTQKCNISASAEEMDKALVKILKWTEGNVPAEQEMYVRINAYILEGTNRLNPVASNSVKLNVKPYYIELKDAVPTMWYLVGNMFGAKWASDKNIGVDALPMFLKPNFSYDKKTGAGEIEYTNYFLTGDYNDKAEVLATSLTLTEHVDIAVCFAITPVGIPRTSNLELEAYCLSGRNFHHIVPSVVFNALCVVRKHWSVAREIV
jgi:starch-binding outer membrane protein SusE/F